MITFLIDVTKATDLSKTIGGGSLMSKYSNPLGAIGEISETFRHISRLDNSDDVASVVSKERFGLGQFSNLNL